MRLAALLMRSMLVGLLIAAAPMVQEALADCPQSVVFEPTTDATLDAGWTGFDHGLSIFGSTLPLAIDCGPSLPPCGTCTIIGLAPDPARPRRCVNDTSILCSPGSEVADCGEPNTCRTVLSPPQPTNTAGIGLCFVVSVAGGATGTVDVESGALSALVSVAADVYAGGSLHPCPRCVGDPVANDGMRDGLCVDGARNGLACDATAASTYTDFGNASFDCPPTANNLAVKIPPTLYPASTSGRTMTLTSDSPPCGDGSGRRCFCGTCNDAAAAACETDADCPLSGGNPGVCDGRRCLGGANDGTPCTTGSTCDSGLCGRPGEPTKPNACLDDTTDPDDPCRDPGDGVAQCVGGPLAKRCADHPNRLCLIDADCDTGACQARNRRCFLDNGILGGSVSVAGAATATVAGVAEPTVLGVLGCAPATGTSLVNYAIGLPGPVRSAQTGRLVFDDGTAFCPLAPASCRLPTALKGAVLQIRDDAAPEKDDLKWKSSKGAATTVAELGMPTTTDDYTVCLYDGFSLRMGVRVPAAGLCDGKPCWRQKQNRFSYRNKSGLPDGITQLDLVAGVAGKARIQVRGRGPLLPLPPLASLTTTLQVQVRHAPSGLCWGAVFIPPFDQVDATRLKDRSD